MKKRSIILGFSWLLSFAACGGSDDPCQADSCSGHGTCRAEDGKPVCACEAGYRGASCDACAIGYQDNDSDGSCLASCPYSGIKCGNHGQCDDASGTARCVCETGYAGDTCQDCAAGYQDKDADGRCAPDCETAALDCHHGACSEDGGKAHCVCESGYALPDCAACDRYFQDNDQNGSCLPDCAGAGLECGLHGVCDDLSGTARCQCDATFAGDHCEHCAEDFQDNDENGTCLPDCAASGLDCHHGSCEDESGVALCTCDTGYTGADCTRCQNGYQDNDHDGICAQNCATSGLVCGAHGRCSDLTGTPICQCTTGYTGALCDSCSEGFQDYDGDGTCRPTCETLGWTCSGHGACDDSSGTAICVCESGYYPDGHGGCTPPNGFTCASATPLDLSLGSVQGTTTGAGGEYSGSCVSNTGPEVVWRFTINEPLHVKFHMTGFDTVLYLRSNCTDAQSEIDCDDDGGGSSSSLISADLAAGTYYLFCDGYGSASGAYTLTMDVTCSTPGTIFDPSSGRCVDDPCQPNPCDEPHKTVCRPVLPASFTCECDPGYIPDPDQPESCMVNPNPTGESCADPIPLSGSTGVIQGTLVGAQNNSEGSCGGSGPDRVYAFSALVRTRASLVLSSGSPALYLRSVCAQPGSEEGCNAPWYGNAQLLEILPPGVHYVWIDSEYSGDAFTLNYDLRPDPCADEESACPGVPTCQANADWTGFTCVCPAGYLPHNGECVDDPCDPNLCTEPHKTRCVPLLPGNYECQCNVGYIPDPGNPSACIMDPNANEWAFFVFLNADNNLEDYGYEDLAEMEVAGSTPYVHIAALFDTASRDNGDARYIYVRPGAFDTLQNLGEVNMSNWEVMAQFGVWAVQNYPARHYAFIMWDHGAGWKNAPPKPVFKGFSSDDNPGSGGGPDEISVSNGDYAQALAAITAAIGDKIDIVGFDACLMGMWEVAEASAPYARYLVASEETEPGPGWAYDGFLPALIQDPLNTDARALGRAIVDAYYNEDPGDSTLSLIDLDSMANLASAMTAFADALRAHTDLYASINSVRNATQAFYYSDNRDLFDFATRIKSMSGVTPDIVTAADALLLQLGTTIAYSRAQADYPGAHGMAIYFPARSSGMDSAYTASGAVWSQHATWDEFLQSFAQ
jgi:hypothetical protein